MLKKLISILVILWVLLYILSILNGTYLYSGVRPSQSVRILNKWMVSIQIDKYSKTTDLSPSQEMSFQLDNENFNSDPSFTILKDKKVLFSYNKFVNLDPITDTVWYEQALKGIYHSWNISAHIQINDKKNKHYFPLYIVNETRNYTINIDVE